MTPMDQLQGSSTSMGPQDSPVNGPAGDVNSQLRQIIMAIGSLAQQAPEAQQELTAAARALTMAQMKLMSSNPDTQQQQPIVAA